MIYDCFMFYENLDLLELRLMTLYDTVDRFVLVEMGMTHTGKKKPMHFRDNQDRFSKYLDKIIQVRCEEIQYSTPIQAETDNRNMMEEGYAEAADNDYIIISDEDEIPDPRAIMEGINKGYDSFCLRQKLFYYYVNCIAAQEWDGPMIYRKRLIPSPQWVRNRRGPCPDMVYGGWHYSFLSSPEMIANKLNNFSEQQVNTPDVNNPENIKRCLETGEDLFHRTEGYARKRFLKMEELDHPHLEQWLKLHPQYFKI